MRERHSHFVHAEVVQTFIRTGGRTELIAACGYLIEPDAKRSSGPLLPGCPKCAAKRGVPPMDQWEWRDTRDVVLQAQKVGSRRFRFDR